MTPTFAWVLAGLGMLGSSLWIWHWLAIRRHRHLQIWLRECPADPPEGGWPTLAMIFAARNEAESVDRATRSMLAQDYPDLDVVAVDDRSTDETGPILDAVAAENPHLQVVHIKELPPGWLGKNHALQSAAEASEAEWLLFTDADVVFAPETLRRAVALVIQEGLDHLTVAPDVPTENLGERIFIAMFTLLISVHAPPWKVGERNSRVGMGIGAFNLVRAEVFRDIGGFRHLKLSIDDDLRLGETIKIAGYRQRLAMGQGMISVRWHVGLWGMVRGLEKNFFARTNFRLPLVAFAMIVLVMIAVMPFVGLFVGPWWTRAYCALGIFAVTRILAEGRGQNGVAWYHGLLLPVGAIACVIALLRSTWFTLRRGGVRWRDHLYPLAELKEHTWRRDAWLREVWRSTH